MIQYTFNCTFTLARTPPRLRYNICITLRDGTLCMYKCSQFLHLPEGKYHVYSCMHTHLRKGNYRLVKISARYLVGKLDRNDAWNYLSRHSSHCGNLSMRRYHFVMVLYWISLVLTIISRMKLICYCNCCNLIGCTLLFIISRIILAY